MPKVIWFARKEWREIQKLLSEITEDIGDDFEKKGLQKDVIEDLILAKKSYDKLGRFLIWLGKYIKGRIGKRYENVAKSFLGIERIFEKQTHLFINLIKALVADLLLIKAKEDIFGFENSKKVFGDKTWERIKSELDDTFVGKFQEFLKDLSRLVREANIEFDEKGYLFIRIPFDEGRKAREFLNKYKDLFPKVFFAWPKLEGKTAVIRTLISRKTIADFINEVNRLAKGDFWKKIKDKFSGFGEPNLKEAKKAFELVGLKYEGIEKELQKKIIDKYKEFFKKLKDNLKDLKDAFDELKKLEESEDILGKKEEENIYDITIKSILLDDVFDFLEMYTMLVILYGIYNLVEALYYGIKAGLINKEKVNKQKLRELYEKFDGLLKEDLIESKLNVIKTKKLRIVNNNIEGREGIDEETFKKIFGLTPARYWKRVLSIYNVVKKVRKETYDLIKEIIS